MSGCRATSYKSGGDRSLLLVWIVRFHMHPAGSGGQFKFDVAVNDSLRWIAAPLLPLLPLLPMSALDFLPSSPTFPGLRDFDPKIKL